MCRSHQRRGGGCNSTPAGQDRLAVQLLSPEICSENTSHNKLGTSCSQVEKTNMEVLQSEYSCS